MYEDNLKALLKDSPPNVMAIVILMDLVREHEIRIKKLEDAKND